MEKLSISNKLYANMAHNQSIPIMEYLLDKNPGFINSKKKKRLLEKKREKQRGKEREGTI